MPAFNPLPPKRPQLANRLEPEFAEPWQIYSTDPSPHNTTQLLNKLKPVITRGVRAYGGKTAGPTTQSHAKRLTLQALKTYDPAQASLSTHITNHLQGLQRVTRQQGQVVRIPERVTLDRSHIEQVRANLEDQHGREPTDQELADAAGISVKRLWHIRKFVSPVSQGFLEHATMSEESGEGYAPSVVRPGSEAWLHIVATDLPETDRKILEWTTGLGGNPVLTNQQIAMRLKLSPGAVSQRKAKIQQLLDQEDRLSPFRANSPEN